MGLLVVLGFMALMIMAFIGTYVLNNRVQTPNIEVDMSGCNGCKSINCGHNPARKFEKEER